MKKISKLEFIKQIVDLLRSEVDEKNLRLILKDYTLYFNHELELGKSEEDVLNFLYSPELFIETLRKYDLEETLKKLGQDEYNIFVELTKDYNYNSSSNKEASNTSNEDDTSKPTIKDDKDKDKDEDKDDDDKNSVNNQDNSNKDDNDSSNNIIKEKPNPNTINKTTKSNTKKGLGYIINFLLGLILLVIFIPIIACGFIAGFMFVALSILFSSTISLLSGFLSTLSIVFIMLSSLCLLTFGIGTICLNIQLIINYVKYFFLVNSTNLEDTQNA
ncbi:MAG: hypothetical protein R3Y29_03950 [bacterium]